MRFFLRLSVVLAMLVGGWFWWEGRLEKASFSSMPPFFQNVVSSILTVEKNIRHRVQMVQSGTLMIKEGKAMIEEGVRGVRK